MNGRRCISDRAPILNVSNFRQTSKRLDVRVGSNATGASRLQVRPCRLSLDCDQICDAAEFRDVPICDIPALTAPKKKPPEGCSSNLNYIRIRRGIGLRRNE
jgi:hypothetical protein